MKFEELLQRLNVATAPSGHHHVRKGWVQFDCPFCGRNSQRWHMGYKISGGYVNCYRCGPHNLVATLVEASGESPSLIKKLLGEVDRRSSYYQEEDKRGTLKLPKGRGPLQKAHKQYLRSRGFDPDELEQLWKLEGIGICNRLAWRIFIPFYFQGEVVSWTTRSICAKATLRYISASETEEKLNHKKLLYGEDYCRHGIIVCEGPTGPWRIGPGAVATCGLSYSQAQLERISRYPIRVICFDNEPKAQQRANRLCDALEVFPGETFNVRLTSEDPGAATRKEVKRLRRLIE